MNVRLFSRLILVLVPVLLLASCAGADRPSSDTTGRPVTVVTVPDATETAPVTQPPATAAPETAEPVTEPSATEPPVTLPPVTEPPVTEPPVTEPPVTEPPAPIPATIPLEGYDYTKPVPQSEPKAAAYFDDAVLIGDSRTEALRWRGNFDLEKTQIISFVGMNVNTFYTEKYFNKSTQTAEELLRSFDGKFSKVYISLGLNELGWPSASGFAASLGKIVDTVRSCNPEALIYLEAIIPMSRAEEENVSWHSLAKVTDFNAAVRKMAAEKKVFYVDCDTAFALDGGYLPADYAPDGIHLNADCLLQWKDYLLSHTVTP